MLNRLLFILALFAVLLTPVGAQSAGLLAYTNSGGQLVVSASDGSARWIVTNPGEVLAPDVRLSWSDNGQLLFGVAVNGLTSLRVADVNRQQVTEILQVNGTASGGTWLDAQTLVIGTPEGIVRVGGGGAAVLVPGGQLAAGQAVSADGEYMLVQAGGAYVLANADGDTAPLEGTAPNAGMSLWAADAPIVAYWTTTPNGTTALNLVNPESGAVLAIDSGSGIPITPLDWHGTTLIYLNATGINALDAACMLNDTCGAIAPVSLLPVNARDVAVTDSGALVYTLDGTRYAAPEACLNAGGCAGVELGAVMPRTTAYTGGDITAFTTAADNTIVGIDAACAAEGGTNCVALTAPAGTVINVTRDGSAVLAVINGQLTALDGTLVALGSVSANTRTAWAR